MGGEGGQVHTPGGEVELHSPQRLYGVGVQQGGRGPLGEGARDLLHRPQQAHLVVRDGHGDERGAPGGLRQGARVHAPLGIDAQALYGVSLPLQLGGGAQDGGVLGGHGDQARSRLRAEGAEERQVIRLGAPTREQQVVLEDAQGPSCPLPGVVQQGACGAAGGVDAGGVPTQSVQGLDQRRARLGPHGRGGVVVEVDPAHPGSSTRRR